MIRIAIYSGVSVQAGSLESALCRDGGFDVTMCPSMRLLLTTVTHQEFDLVLIETTPETTSPALRELQRQAPRVRIVLWADTLSTTAAMEAMVMGFRGILRKSLPRDLQLNCLRRVHAGELWFEKAVTARVPASRHASLSGEERALMELLSQGLKNREIAGRLRVSDEEVTVFLSQLFEKFGVKDRFELAVLSLKTMGWRRGGPSRALRGGKPEGETSESVTLPMLPTLQ